MTDFGGFGGVQGGRDRDLSDQFENAVDRTFGSKLRADGRGRSYCAEPPYKLGERIWGSLANVDWKHKNGDTASYTFRAAGDLLAAIVGAGDYMDWYCSAPYGEADPEFAAAMEKEGWTQEPMNV